MDARRVALDALCDVTDGGAYAQLALDARLRATEIAIDDKRLATSIFYAALENRLRIAWVLRQFAESMPMPVIERILHIAVAQLLFLDRVPDHAVVDEAVKQVKGFGLTQYAPFVNGTLRSLIRARDAGEIRYPDPDKEPVKALSIQASVPVPLLERIADDYGMAETAAIVAYQPDMRRQIVRPNLLQMDCAAFEAYLTRREWPFEKLTVPGAYALTGRGDLSADPDYLAGLFSIQGEASMLAAYAVAPVRGQNLLDACAAPGGKAALLCELLGGTGRVSAWEIHEHREELLYAVKKRLRLDNLRVARRDATQPREAFNEAFDAVLIDAPCSGLGVAVNKPDIKYRVTPEDINALAQTQRLLLDACAPYVAVGGRLVYSTCTFMKDENERQIRAFLARHGEYRLETDDSWLPETLRPRMADGLLQLMPQIDGMEGFFIARMKRVSP